MRQVIQKTGLLLLLLLGLNMKECKTEDLSNPSTSPQAREEVTTQQSNCIQLEALGAHTAPETWKQFFQERGAEWLWLSLKNLKYVILNINLKDLPASITQNQVCELCSAVIRYLCYGHHGRPIEVLTLNGKDATSNQQLTQLPAEIGWLTDLQALYCMYNQLTTLPSSLTNLTNLRSLNLSYNHITRLPSEIGQLTQLTQLNLSDNALTELPSTITGLTKLEGLNLSNNQLKALQQELYPWLQNNFVKNSTLLDLIPYGGFSISNNPLIRQDDCTLLTNTIWQEESPHLKELKTIRSKLKAHNLPSANHHALSKRLYINQLIQDKQIVFFSIIPNIKAEIAETIPFYWTQYFGEASTMQDRLTNNADPHTIPDYYVLSFPNPQYIHHEKDLSKLYIAPEHNQ